MLPSREHSRRHPSSRGCNGELATWLTVYPCLPRGSQWISPHSRSSWDSTGIVVRILVRCSSDTSEYMMPSHGRPRSSVRSDRFQPGAVEIGAELVCCSPTRLRKNADDNAFARKKLVDTVPHEVPQLSADSVADHRVPHRLRHDEADQGRNPVGCVCFIRRPEVEHKALRFASNPTSYRGAKISGRTHAIVRRKHEPSTSQAESFARPLRRRPERMARPARVAIRLRKPCTLARLRLLGWKVRFTMMISTRFLAIGQYFPIVT